MITKELKEIQLRVKKYLSLDNVSLLVGAGGSFHLGAPIIRDIPQELYEKVEKYVNKYFSSKTSPSFEDLFNCLQAERFLEDKKGNDSTEISETILLLQNWLLANCDTETTNINKEYSGDELLQKNRYYYHEVLLKKLLQRANNLKRINLFTTNYDMAFDYALDNLGVYYINGFMGMHNRCFRPEIFDYDLFYPGQTVSGKVYRAERVIKYYKLHGSLSWTMTTPTFNNTYGIREYQMQHSQKEKLNNEIVIYPCATKKTFTLDMPYSELFRRFSQAISQPQSVLFCIGYSFNDEHINDIIYQSLAIPTFTLIVANYSNKKDSNNAIAKLEAFKDKRIIILPEANKEISSFCGFTQNIMPDLYEDDENIMIKETMQKLYPAEGELNVTKL